MTLSKLSFTSKHKLEIHNEKDFETLALVAQNPRKKYITFINEKKYFSKLNENVSMVITKPELKEFVPDRCGVAVSDNPDIVFFELQNFLEDNEDYVRPVYKTVLGKNYKIGRLTSIAENNVTIGNNVVIEDFVTIYPNTVIGDNVIIRSGTRIGSQGFGYKRYSDNTILMINHYGGVVIENNADIHCNVCIDRAVYPWDNTVIGEYTKIDNLVQIAHGVKIGKGCLLVAGSCIGGRTEIGNACWLGIGAVISNGLVIGNNSSVTLGSVVIRNISENNTVSGFYAINHKDFLTREFYLRKLK